MTSFFILLQKLLVFILYFVIILSGCFMNASFATEPLEIPSSPNPVGSGARALGMGGAFIAVADDATAASWNPAGLCQLDRPELSFVGDWFHRIEDNDFGTNPEANGEQTVSRWGGNYLSASFPTVFFGRKFVFSANCQKLYDFTRKWDFPLVKESLNEDMFLEMDYRQEGTLSAFGIAMAFDFTPRLSFGATVNIWNNNDVTSNEWEQESYSWNSDRRGGFTSGESSFERYSFEGYNINVNIGIMWKIGNQITMGFVCKSPLKADLRHEYQYTIYKPEGSRSELVVTDEKLEMPMTFGTGIAWRMSDEITLALDIYTVLWNDFILTDADGNETTLITGRSPEESDINQTWHARLGADWLVAVGENVLIPLRCGFYYDPSPAEGAPDDYYGLSIGAGYVLRQLDAKAPWWHLSNITGLRYSFDLAYNCRFGKDVGTTTLKYLDFSQDFFEHSVLLSCIVYLGEKKKKKDG